MEPEELKLIQSWRKNGHSWTLVAELLGIGLTGDQIRKRYMRATGAYGERHVLPPTGDRTIRHDFGKPVRALVVPDTQIRYGVPMDHLLWAGRFAADKGFDVIAHTGDWADNNSISSYHTQLSRENERLAKDDAAVIQSLKLFQDGLQGYVPKLQFMTEGNHEDRRRRLIDDFPQLQGTIPELPFKEHGWTTYPFLQPVSVQGCWFAHYFTRTAKGWAGKNPHPNAQTMTRREMVSCIAGHSPGLDVYIHPTSTGMIRGLIAGSFYEHDESYQGPQGNRYWRGVLVLNQLYNGFYELTEVSLEYLKGKYR